MWRGKPRVNSSSLEPSLAFSSVQSLGRVRIFATPKIPDFRERQRDRRVWEPPVHSHLEFHGGGRGLSVLLKTVLPPSSDVCLQVSPGSATASTLLGRLSKLGDPCTIVQGPNLSWSPFPLLPASLFCPLRRWGDSITGWWGKIFQCQPRLRVWLPF